MSNGEQSYNLPELRKLLNLFDDLELDAWCLDHFSTVYDKFSSGMRKDQKINLLLIYCRRGPNRFEKLLAIVQAEDEEAFKQFEPSIIGKAHDPLFVLGMERGKKLRRLSSELNEWKVIHHDVQGLLSEIDKTINLLTLYKFKKDRDWLELAVLGWKELQASKLRQISDKWSFQYVESSLLSHLQKSMTLIDDVAERLMNKITEADFDSFYLQYRQFRAFLWEILQSADEKVKILVEQIVTEIGG